MLITPQPSNKSLMQSLASLNESERLQILSALSTEQLLALRYQWEAWARPNQLPPTDRPWTTWLILAGRGFGKTRTGVEWIRKKVEGPSPLIAPPGGVRRIALVAETAADARDVMVLGESGLLENSPKDQRPRFVASTRSVTWPNGATAFLYNAVEPEQLRGPQHDAAWVDELGKYRYAQDVWDQLQFGLRLGMNPQQCVTTTPRNIKVLKDIIADSSTVVTRGKTSDNTANLAPAFVKSIVKKYQGTRLGRQELDAELLDDVPGALWQRDMIDACRITPNVWGRVVLPDLKRIVVAIDPATTSGEDADLTGLVVSACGVDDRGYVLADYSGRYTPAEWAKKAIWAFHHHRADRIVAEVNNGGEMVRHTLHTMDPNIPFLAVHASRGKVTRAEPVSSLYEQGRVSHVGSLPELEDQQCGFTQEGNPDGDDRVDALVWGMTDVMVLNPGGYPGFVGR